MGSSTTYQEPPKDQEPDADDAAALVGLSGDDLLPGGVADDTYVLPGIGTKVKEEEWIGAFQVREAYYRFLLQEAFQKMVRYMRLLLAQRDDLRGEDEQWRSNVFVPYPYSGSDTKAAAVMDLLMTDPFSEVEGRTERTEDAARKVDRLLDYTTDQNKLRSRLKDILLECIAQGTSMLYTGHKKRSATVNMRMTPEQKKNFTTAVELAVAAGVVKPPMDPDGFEAWRMLVNAAKKPGVPPIPPVPVNGPVEVVSYDGPWIERCSIFGFRFDPLIEDVQDQVSFMRRCVRSKAWVDKQVADGVLDADAVEEASKGRGETMLEDWERQIADMMGIHSATSKEDPSLEDGHEFFEVFEPGDVKKPYKLVMNRLRMVNKDKRWPFDDGQIPYEPIRNIRIAGYFMGMSDFEQVEDLYAEMNKLRGLRLDAVTLATLPVLVKSKDSALPELRRRIKPGAVFDEARPNSIRYLTGPTIDAAVFREIFETKNDIDESNSTPSQLRGNQATVGRVSATEAQGRFNSSLLRIKQLAIAVEEDLTPVFVKCLMRWVQFGGDPINVPRKGTRDGSPFDMLEVSREDILGAIKAGFKFRGATRALDRDKQLQNHFQYTNVYGQNLMPKEMRLLMKRVANLMGMRDVDQIITDEGTEMAQKMWEAKMAGAAGPAGAGPMPGQGGPQMPPPGPPSQSAVAGALAAPQPPAGSSGPPQDPSADMANQIQQGNSIASPGVVS
jgi:hypothetical protein